MTEDGAVHITQDPVWQLLAEISLPAVPDSELRLAEWITATVQELGLQPVQLKRVREAITRAVRNVTRHGNQSRPDSFVSIRARLSAASGHDRSPSGPDAPQKAQWEHRGWGFFLIEKYVAGPQVGNAGSQRVIEVFLYQ